MPVEQKILKPQGIGAGSDGDHTSNLYLSSTEVSYASGDTFTLKTSKIRILGTTHTIDATRDEDDFVKHLSTNRVSGEIEISGHVIQGQLIGFNNLPDDSVRVAFKYADNTTATHALTVFMSVHSLRLDWSRKSTTVPVVLRGRITATNQADQIREGATL
tara:strand:+ start:578 stop:1057 length:480 start_codon:yes stop_codon:yes gene_type:complete